MFMASSFTSQSWTQLTQVVTIHVRWTDPTNGPIGWKSTAYFYRLTNTVRLIHQSYHSSPMDRFNEYLTIRVRWTDPMNQNISNQF